MVDKADKLTLPLPPPTPPAMKQNFVLISTYLEKIHYMFK